MLKHLSLRNARRQAGEYALYFITLTCIVSFLYAFNTLLFSDSVKALPDMEVLPYMIVAASVLIILITGRIISYMAGYMLKRRSREFGIYMLCGIPNRDIATLLSRETALLGMLSFLPGMLLGALLSQLLEAVVLPMLGSRYRLRFPFSLPESGLTLAYFFLMLLSSLAKNRRWIRRVTLRDLLAADRKAETFPLSGNALRAGLFLLSLAMGGAGFWFLMALPIGSGFDFLVGTGLLAAFLFGFFQSIPAFLATLLAGRDSWKYRRHRLAVFRGFTARIRSTSTALGMLSTLFALALAFYGIGISFSQVTDKMVNMNLWDIQLLHPGELWDFTSCEETIARMVPLEASYTYAIYTDQETALTDLRQQASEELGYSGNPMYREFFHDTYMKQSDYWRLQELLGVELETPEDASPDMPVCYVHCLPSLADSFREYLSQAERTYAGYPISRDDMFTEDFCQSDIYGNGLGYILVVPDEAVESCRVLYSQCVMLTKRPLVHDELDEIADACGLTRLRRNTVRSSSDGPGATAFAAEGDYLSGKWMDKDFLNYLPALAICLFYLALVLEITGAAILATQLLGDRDKRRRQDLLLSQLGMEPRQVRRLGRWQTRLFFLLPLPPAFAVSSAYVILCGTRLEHGLFYFPSAMGPMWLIWLLVRSLLVFGLLYGIYYAAARISDKGEKSLTLPRK